MGDLGQALWMVAAVGAALWLVSTLFKARQRIPPPTRELDPVTRHEVEQSLDDIFVRLQDYSRETLAKLDTKVRLLNQLVGEAERREKSLRELLARLPPESVPSTPGRETDAAPSRIPPSAAPPAAAPVERRETPPPPLEPPVDRRRERVCAMADEGRTLREITLATGLQTGEVEMILNLRRMPST
ncbi:MAG: hypothetical protein HYY93_04310 [Planctomycetes bacterium]|nr:hypothetical protein [Planctomycetota bacterium]